VVNPRNPPIETKTMPPRMRLPNRDEDENSGCCRNIPKKVKKGSITCYFDQEKKSGALKKEKRTWGGGGQV